MTAWSNIIRLTTARPKNTWKQIWKKKCKQQVSGRVEEDGDGSTRHSGTEKWSVVACASRRHKCYELFRHTLLPQNYQYLSIKFT